MTFCGALPLLAAGACVLLPRGVAGDAVAPPSSGLAAFSSEELATKAISDPSFDLSTVTASDVEDLVHRGWHTVVNALIGRSHQGSEEESQRAAAQVRQAIKAERNRLDDLTRALDRNYGRAVDVSPSMQWAQNSTHVFLAVKFAQRWNAPGALEVSNETVDVSACCFNFTAYGEHSFIRRKYHLSFQLFRGLLPGTSTWSFASVGRMTVTMVKASPGNWPRLYLERSKVPKNLGIWRDMLDKWKPDLEKWPVMLDVPTQQKAEKAPSSTKSEKSQTKTKKKRRARRDEDDEDEALDKEVELLSECPKSSYAGTSVAELCDKTWSEVVPNSAVPGRRWVVEFYSSQGDGNAEAMKALVPVWKRLGDVFSSMTPNGRIGAVDCARQMEFCKKFGVTSVSKLPQVMKFSAAGAPTGDVWAGNLKKPSIEDLAAWGGEDSPVDGKASEL